MYVNHQDGSNPAANSIWRYNVGNRSRGPSKGEWSNSATGLYVDNSSSGYRVHNNIVIDASGPIGYNDTWDDERAGKDVWFYNNTLYLCGRTAFGSFGNSKKRDAELHLINNLAIASDPEALGNPSHVMTHQNNVYAELEAVKDAANLDFTPIDEALRTGGVPVRGKQIPYVGAVDPDQGMWRYGADESKIPPLSSIPKETVLIVR